MILGLVLTCCFTIPAEVTIDSATISLGDLVALPSADPRRTAAFGASPAPGLARRLAKSEILARLSSLGFDHADIAAGDSVLVRRKAVLLNRDEVLEAVRASLSQRFANAEVEIAQLELPDVFLPTDSATIAAVLPPRFDVNAPVFVRVDVRAGSLSRSVFARAMIRVLTVQPVLRSPVAAHKPVSATDIEWRPAPLDTMRELLTEDRALEGMVAKRDLSPGQVLSLDLLYKPLFVQRGDSVTVTATSGKVTIAAMMRARAAGRLGETIPVEHLSGGSPTLARIVGPGRLEALRETR